MAKLKPQDKVDIINAYTSLFTPMIELAEKYYVSRQAIYKLLKKSGIDTSKKLIRVSCTVCGAVLNRPKCRVRKQLNHFCDYECYYAFLEAGNGNPYIHNRYGQRIARQIISQFFDIQDDHVIHHEDRNTLNNMPYNLKVFTTQGDHVRYHRGFDVEPLWDGTTLHSQKK